MEHPQLARLEDRAYRTFLDDGSLDILLGFFVLSFAVSTNSSLDYLPALFVFFAYHAWSRTRATLIEPRIGRARLRPERLQSVRRGKMKVALLILFLSLAVAAIVASGGGLRERAHELRPIITTFALGAPVLLAAWLLGLRRWVGYALIIVVAGTLAQIGVLPPGMELFVSGGLVAASGATLLLSFLRRHPLPGQEAS